MVIRPDKQAKVAKGKWNQNKKYSRRVEDTIKRAQRRGQGPAIPASRFSAAAVGCLKAVSSKRLSKIAPDAMNTLQAAAEARTSYYNLGSVKEESFQSLF